MMNRFIFFIIFYLTNHIYIPYRLKYLEYIYRKLRENIAKHLFSSVGKDVVIRPQVKLSYIDKISIGDRSSIGDKSTIVASGKVHIGKNVMMGPEVMIYSQNHEVTKRGTRLIDGKIIQKEVLIKDDVWIGARTIILPGAIISEGTVIAAGTVVPGKKFPPNVVLGGNPARVIKNR
ncbi:acyltransferase [Enterococcus faecalis]|uniref:acyltransferase n=2 Tax=Enterococcus faecalis TaxID=1351 RepID=UPI001F5A55A9|nr:acyltransferase [Enterococcus faecalis]